MIVCSWMMTFNLVIAVDLAWPEWWHGLWGWCSFFAFPFKFFVPVDLIFPSVAVSNAAEYFATLTVQPLLALYVWYRASFFHEKSVTEKSVTEKSGDSLLGAHVQGRDDGKWYDAVIDEVHDGGASYTVTWSKKYGTWPQQTLPAESTRMMTRTPSRFTYHWLFADAKKDWLRWDTGRGWLGTVVFWLSFWLVPPAVGLALAIQNDTLEPVEQGYDTLEPIEQGNETISSKDAQEYHIPWYSAAWLCFGSFVPFLLGYKVILRGAYKTAQNRSDPDEVFFGQWAPQRVHTACIHHVDHALVGRRRIYSPLETANYGHFQRDDLGRFCTRDARDFGSAGLGARPPL